MVSGSFYSAASLHAFLKANLAAGATAKTDGWSGYPGAPGVNHDPDVVGKMAAHIICPGRTASFRFNRRRTRHAAFRSLLGIATAHPVPLKRS